MPGYPALSLVSALETLQSYNTLAQNDYYAWELASCNAAPVSSTLGGVLSVKEYKGADDFDVLVIVSGLSVENYKGNDVLNAVRTAARRGCMVLGLCTGGIVMAKSGVINDKETSVHWRYENLVEEMFSNVEVARSCYCFDGKYGSTSGGVAAIDLMLSLIAKDHSEDRANDVAHYLNYTPIRSLNYRLDTSLANRMSILNPTVSKVVALMEANIEDPLDGGSIAKNVGLSIRQVERLFQRYLSRTPLGFYLDLRLSKARDLLIQTNLSVTEISISAGFQTASTFSKNYRRKYGVSPSMVRRGLEQP